MSVRRFLAGMAVFGVVAALVACVPPPPTGPTVSVQIEGGRAAINRSSVTLSLTASASAVEMRAANGSDVSALTGAAWQPVRSTLDWELLPGEGSRSVVVQVRDRNGATARATASIVVDTTPPEVAVTSHAPGATIDVSKGELVALAGTASDSGSGVEAVTMRTPDGSEAPTTLQPNNEWATPIGAPESGSFTFGLAARDVAGNTTNLSLPLTILAMPATEGTVARPTTLELDAAQQAALVSVTEGALVFAGDLRPALDGVATIISAPIDPVAPDGLLRRVMSSDFDPAAEQTTVLTETAELAEAFAQFSFTTPAPMAGLRASASADPCDAFLSGRSVRATYTNDVNFGEFGALGGGAVTFKAKQVVFADVDVNVDVGWRGVDVSGSIGAGTMSCGSVDANATASFIRNLELVSGPLFCGAIGPVPVCIEAEAGIRAGVAVTSPTLFAQFNAGADIRYNIGGEVDASTQGDFTAGAKPFTGNVSTKAYVKLKLTAANFVSAGLLDGSAGPNLDATTSGLKGCVDLSAGFNPGLSVKIGRWKITAFEVNFNKTYKLFCQTWPFGTGTPTTTTTTTTSTTTTTTSLPPSPTVTSLGRGQEPGISGDGRFVVYFDFPGDVRTLYVADRQTGTVVDTRVVGGLIGLDGRFGRPNSANISDDGRFVTFAVATYDQTGIWDWDRQTGQLTQVASSYGLVGQTPDISGDGRFIAYVERNVIDLGEQNFVDDVYLWDRQTRQSEQITETYLGFQPVGDSYGPSVSDDGRYVAFASVEANLVQADSNNTSDVFVRDRQAGTTVLVSRGRSGTSANSYSTQPSMSSDGRYIAFDSSASDLVEVDSNRTEDVFLWDAQGESIRRVSIGPLGAEGNGSSAGADISADGRFVTYTSVASNFATGDSNYQDAFLWDAATGSNRRLSSSSAFGRYPTVSDDGRYVAYESGINVGSGDTEVAILDRIGG